MDYDPELREEQEIIIRQEQQIGLDRLLND